MGTLFISLLTLFLLLISAFVVLLVLMQRTSQSGGMGAALGGGAAESAFGSETNSILMKGTIYGIVAFFVVALGLYLLYQSEAADRTQEVDLGSVISASGNEAAGDSPTGTTGDMNQDGTGTVPDGSTTIEAEAEEAVESTEAEATDAVPATN